LKDEKSRKKNADLTQRRRAAATKPKDFSVALYLLLCGFAALREVCILFFPAYFFIHPSSFIPHPFDKWSW
jgi:hypothetical protein